VVLPGQPARLHPAMVASDDGRQPDVHERRERVNSMNKQAYVALTRSLDTMFLVKWEGK
jgi:hypothetical protein